VITYQPDCPDGTTRQVDLTIKNFCGASVTESRSYTSPRDTKVFEPIRLRLGKVTAHGNEEVVVPLELLDTLSKFTPVFHPAVFIVRFDTSNLRFIDMATPQGSLLENVTIKATPAAGGVTFETMEKKLVDTRTVPALLAELKFLTRDIVDKDTTPCPIWLTDWYFRAGCFTVQPESGEIKVIGKAPSIDCRFDAPESLSVDTVKGSYHPNPFTVTQVIANSGVVAALNPRFKLHVDTTQFALVDPPVDSVQAGVAELQPSDSTSVSWELRAKARPADARHAVSITAHFDNHPHVECGRSIFVPRLPATSAEAPVETSAWSFHLYPDPARGGVSVVLTGAGTDGFSAALYDAVGRLVTTVARDRGAESMPVVFDLHGLPAGVYHVAVYGGGGVKSAKFVKAP
jgi:hypothetical protein